MTREGLGQLRVLVSQEVQFTSVCSGVRLYEFVAFVGMFQLCVCVGVHVCVCGCVCVGVCVCIGVELCS